MRKYVIYNACIAINGHIKYSTHEIVFKYKLI